MIVSVYVNSSLMLFVECWVSYVAFFFSEVFVLLNSPTIVLYSEVPEVIIYALLKVMKGEK